MKLVDKLKEIGLRHNATAGQVTLAWLLAQGNDIIPIPGTKKIEASIPLSVWLTNQLTSEITVVYERELGCCQFKTYKSRSSRDPRICWEGGCGDWGSVPCRTDENVVRRYTGVEKGVNILSLGGTLGLCQPVWLIVYCNICLLHVRIYLLSIQRHLEMPAEMRISDCGMVNKVVTVRGGLVE